ncbi:uncharacterized protein LOC114354804 [Ostrinia furnacalis]|uniref:uncharacterized protein LOC114354804 n=1 Tax=Ostrinia furnacalis TaxID=93504 RepID=UPI00104029EA|nr:uncharacterized protein LOC114354804 [Ostrinia furnacalis]
MAPHRKVSLYQMEILAKFAETNKHVALGRATFSTPLCQQDARLAWEAVSKKLNAAGTKKTPEQWRRYWVEYKAKLKTKAADQRRGTPLSRRLLPLTDLEQRFLEIIGYVSTETEERDADFTKTQTNTAGASRVKSQRPSLEVEWLDYETGSDEELVEDEDRSQSEEPQESGPDEIHLISDEEAEMATGPYKDRWKNLLKNETDDSSCKKIKLSKRIKMEDFESDQSYKRSRRISETDLIQNNSVNTSTEHDNKKPHLHKKNKSVDVQDPDLLFFHSILPEMKEMTPEQKRQFKMGVWSLANQILEENTLNSPFGHSSEFSQDNQNTSKYQSSTMKVTTKDEIE